jgi:NAD(P)-dependent dehydrogenase (short-subunit alcohol dehydrogenase family)
MPRLVGKVALVTGSTQGLGLGIADRLIREGAAVVLNGRSAESGAHALEGLSSLGGRTAFIAADVGTRANAERLVREATEQFGRLDVLVNNAQAISPLANVLDPITDEYLDSTLSSGLYASLWTSRAAFPFMRGAGGGRTVNVASINGAFGSKYGAAYNSTKEAIRGLTRTLANEFGSFGITVNVILPAGWSRSYQEFYRGDTKKIDAVARLNPMRRHGRAAQDIGAAVAGLCVDSARFITGQSLYVDGGANLNGLPQLHKLEAIQE